MPSVSPHLIVLSLLLPYFAIPVSAFAAPALVFTVIVVLIIVFLATVAEHYLHT